MVVNVPGTTSGTYTFSPSNYAVLIEAFDRIRIRPAELTRHHLNSGRTSLNLELLDWSNSGLNLWKVVSGTINLIANQGTYSIDQSIETLTDVWYSQVNGGGSGINNDRILTPMTRSQWAQIPNKNLPGTPGQYWYEMLPVPQISFWQAPSIGAPSYVVNWYGLQRMQDANLGNGEAPDLIYRAYDALCARMAQRLFTKFGPDDPARAAAMEKRLNEQAERAWDNFQTRDQETGPMKIQPNASSYASI